MERTVTPEEINWMREQGYRQKQLVEFELERNAEGMKYAKLHMLVSLGGVALNAALGGIVSLINEDAAILIMLPMFLASLVAIPVLSIMTYVKGGGLGTAIKTLGKVASWAWFLIPYFPIDIMVFVGIMVWGIMMFFYFPLFFVWRRKKHLEKELGEAYRLLTAGSNIIANGNV